MAKWADYAITAVRYNLQRTHIERLRVHPCVDSTVTPLGSATEKTRQDVVSAINNRTTYVTATNPNGTWRKGAKVEVIYVNGIAYLRTDGNSRIGDNLGELPEF